ncbi:MAG: NifB/NifX family molybdenum-iron cluster-binding protein [Pseudothermotoga sp.]
MLRIIVPTLDGSTISSHFGRAPYFAVVDLDENGNVIKIDKLQNRSDHFGGFEKPKDVLLTLNPTALIVQHMGPGALEAFERAGVAVFRTDTHSVEEVIKDYRDNKLEKLTEGCFHSKQEAHHDCSHSSKGEVQC